MQLCKLINMKEDIKEQPCTTARVERPFKHSVKVQMRFNDIDMLGHLNNSVYFSYFDIGKADYFNTIRGTKNHWGKLDIVIANVNCDFIAPTYYTESIAVKTQVTHFHNKSFHVLQALMNETTGQIKALCRSVMVGFDPATGTSAPLSQEWKDAITNYEGME